MTPEEFIKKWKDSERTERAASQQHFLELCDLLEVPKPGEKGIPAKDYEFAVRLKKPGRKDGEADVFKRKCFAWEYKGPKKSLVEAYRQIKDYTDALDNPPLLIVSDMREIQIHTNFTNTPAFIYIIPTAELGSPEQRQRLYWAFTEPERLRPTSERKRVTEEAARQIGELANTLRRSKLDPRRIAHFLNKIVFCMFAEDTGLLPNRIFSEILEHVVRDGIKFDESVRDLFRAMKDRDGRFGMTKIPWFNGGLFADDDVIDLSFPQVVALRDASALDWKYIEPSIFGTLFESGLDPERRQEMASLFDAKGNGNGRHAQPSLFAKEADKGVGIHYTDEEKIMKIVEPVVLRPLRAEWEAVKAEIAQHRDAKAKAKSPAARTKEEDAIRKAYHDFRVRLGAYRVLDPACGSGNFLYMALLKLKDFDRAVESEARDMGLPADNDRVTPEAVKGLEINPYAAELAQLTIWIGEIQWQMNNSGGLKRAPILGNLRQIENRDALLDERSGNESKWPKADAIVGNPPFLGGKLLLRTLKEEFVKRLFELYVGRVPAEADLVCYWFAKAGEQIRLGNSRRAGLVATNSIRGGANRRALEYALHGAQVVKGKKLPKAKTAEASSLTIFDAWDDEAWVVDGAAVRVSLVCFGGVAETPAHLNGKEVTEVFADLTARVDGRGADLTKAVRLRENADIAFMGDTKGGSFDIEGTLARQWLELPNNPNGRTNADVLQPWANGMDVTRRSSDTWIINFGWEMGEAEAALFEAPFAWLQKHVKPERAKNRRENYKKFWWRHVEPRPGMCRALREVQRFIVTPTVAKHRVFAFLRHPILADHQLIAIARDDDVSFGLLQSRAHEIWALRLGTWLGVGNDPRYTPSTTFETFPFPQGLTPNIPAKDYANDPRAIRVAEAAKKLNELREAWLNPADLVKRVPEVVPGYPDRILPVGEKAAKELKKRTLTNLYNERPQWLANAHKALDEAVAAAYGWPADLSDDEILARLLALNLERAAKQSAK